MAVHVNNFFCKSRGNRSHPQTGPAGIILILILILKTKARKSVSLAATGAWRRRILENGIPERLRVFGVRKEYANIYTKYL